MIFAYFTLAVALLIEVVGAYYSITGLAAIFSGAIVPILIMGGSLELGKVTAAVWLKNNWHRASIQFKACLLPAVVMLMIITSMGIFGFLSKAHSDQSLVTGDATSKVAIYDEKIATERENVAQAKKAIEEVQELHDALIKADAAGNVSTAASLAVAAKLTAPAMTPFTFQSTGLAGTCLTNNNKPTITANRCNS